MSYEYSQQLASAGTPGPEVALAQLAALVRSSDDAIIGGTPDGTITSWNAGAERLYGYSAAEALGRSLHMILPPESWPDWDDLLADTSGCALPARDAQHLTRDGRRIDVSVTVSPVRGPHGELLGISAIARDITARRQVEREISALLMIAERLNAAADPEQVLQEVVAVGVEFLHARAASIVTNEGDHALRRYYWEAGAWEPLAFRIPIDGTIAGWVIQHGRPFRSDDLSQEPLHYPAATPRGAFTTCLSVPVLNRTRETIGVLHLWDRDGGQSFSDADLRIAIGISEYAAVAWERASIVLRLVQLSEEQRRSERLRLAGELTAGLAHDLNNVLSIAIGRLDVFSELQRQQTEIPEVMHESLGVVRTALFDATQTVRRLQTFARGHAAHFTDVRLAEIARDAIELARPRWQREALALGRTILVHQRFTAPGLVHGDATEIREAVLNLLINAVDALPSGGDITVTVDETAGAVQLSVADSGDGMSPQVLARAWEPFFTTKGDIGTGLGLPMVLGIAERHGAEATIDSSPSYGTTVTLRFPPAAAPDAGALPPQPPPASIPTLRVLVVDDEPRVRETTATMLRLLHQIAIEAASAAEARQLLAAEPFDLLITDHGMPSMTGLDLIRRVRIERPALPIVLLTGWGDALSSEAIEATGARLASKPLALEDLRTLLTWAAERRSSP